MDRKEIRLIDKARKGEPGAFSKLMNLKARDITYITWSVLGNCQDAEDAAQEAMTSMCRYISDLKNPNAFKSWMYQIVYRSCMDVVKKRSREKTSIADIPEDMLVEENFEASPHQYNIYLENRKLLLEKINELPEKYRTCLYLFYYEDLSYKEISAVLGESVEWVGNRMTRARRKLKIEVDKTNDFEEGAAAYGASAVAMKAAFDSLRNRTWASSAGKTIARYIKTQAKTLDKAPWLTGSTVAKVVVASVVAAGLVAGGFALSKNFSAEKPAATVSASSGASSATPQSTTNQSTEDPVAGSPEAAPTEVTVTGGETPSVQEDASGGFTVENTIYYREVEPGGQDDPEAADQASNKVSTKVSGVSGNEGAGQVKTGDVIGAGVLVLLVAAAAVVALKMKRFSSKGKR